VKSAPTGLVVPLEHLADYTERELENMVRRLSALHPEARHLPGHRGCPVRAVRVFNAGPSSVAAGIVARTDCGERVLATEQQQRDFDESQLDVMRRRAERAEDGWQRPGLAYSLTLTLLTLVALGCAYWLAS